MTSNQIAYHRLLEETRHNKADEQISRERNRFGLIQAGLSSIGHIAAKVGSATLGLLR